MVAAETPYLAADARELVRVEYEPLRALANADDALAADSVLFRRAASHGDVDGAFARAAHVLRERFTHGRLAAAPMEPRGMIADWDGGSSRSGRPPRSPRCCARRWRRRSASRRRACASSPPTSAAPSA